MGDFIKEVNMDSDHSPLINQTTVLSRQDSCCIVIFTCFQLYIYQDIHAFGEFSENAQKSAITFGYAWNIRGSYAPLSSIAFQTSRKHQWPYLNIRYAQGTMSNSQNFNKDRKASMAEGYDTPMTTNKCAINSHRPNFDFVA